MVNGCVTMYNYFHSCLFVNSIRFALFSLKRQMVFAGVFYKFIDLGFVYVILGNYMSELRNAVSLKFISLFT